MMRAGSLRHRLTFQAPRADQRDSTGDDLGLYADQFTVWGSVEPLSGSTFFAAQHVNPEITGRVRVRYSPDTALIEASWRILHRDRIYTIIAPAIDVDLRARELEFLVQEMPAHAHPRN